VTHSSLRRIAQLMNTWHITYLLVSVVAKRLQGLLCKSGIKALSVGYKWQASRYALDNVKPAE